MKEKKKVACKSAEIISRSLKKDDSLYYTFFGSKSMLQEEMQKYPRINVFRNVTQMPESAILEQILHSDSKKGKLNVIFDGFNGANLAKYQANKRIKNSNIIFIAQTLTTERRPTDTRLKVSIFKMLESMKLSEQFNYNVRLEEKKEIGLATTAEDSTSNSKETEIR